MLHASILLAVLSFISVVKVVTAVSHGMKVNIITYYNIINDSNIIKENVIIYRQVNIYIRGIMSLYFASSSSAGGAFVVCEF